MDIIRGVHNVTLAHRKCVVTMGNFDGMHRGHQSLLQQLLVQGQALGLPTLVILFEPQPNEFFAPQGAARLMRFREKVEALSAMGIDRVLCLGFNARIAAQSAQAFVRTVLVEKLAAHCVLVGDDFHFGCKRIGNFALLQQLGDRYHFKADCMRTYILKGARVSSTRIRELLEAGNMPAAAELLGRPFSMRGKIVQGDKRGRMLGCPTANIHLHRALVPVGGVFAVEMWGIDQHVRAGVANVGIRPTVAGGTRALLEVHLLNFDGDIYGRRVEVRFLHKFRDEKKFATFADLQQQIFADVKWAGEWHRARGASSHNRGKV